MRSFFTYLFMLMAVAANADDYVKDAEPSILEVHYTRIQITDTTQRDKQIGRAHV